MTAEEFGFVFGIEVLGFRGTTKLRSFEVGFGILGVED